jgi:hypothetical protein
MAVGKISGPLLKENLLRDGIDLAFETDLIYLDVNNRRVGIKTSAPSHDFTVNGTTRTTNLEVTTNGTIGNVVFNGDQLYSNTGTLNLFPNAGGSIVYQNKLIIDSLKLEGNAITNTNVSSPDINITPNGTGSVNLNANTLVNGNLHATGTITADGNLTIGDGNTDNVIFNADVASDIIPDVDNTYQLGNSTKKWKDVWVNNLVADTVSGSLITVAGINIALSQGNIYYVATNGNDGNTGIHQNDPLSSVGRALDLATDGDTIFIYPGTYQETMPLIVPAGVSIRGAGIRSVTIEPDSDVTVDVFLLNGETTIEDITIKGFEYDAGTNTGYAFRFAPGFKVTTRSPYIRNVTVLTFGSTVRLATNPVDDPRGFLAGDAGRGAYIDGSIVDSTSKEATMLFHSVTFICPGVDVITMTNGVRVEWLNCFTYFADRGLYAVSGSSGFAGAGLTRLRINSRTGTWNVGNTVTYYDTNGTTVLATGTIASIDGNYVNLTGKCIGFQTITDRTSKTVYAQGDAKLSTSIKKFGLSSLALDGIGDYAKVDSQPDFNFGTDNFCLEAWVYRTTSGTYRTIFDTRTSATEVAIFLGINTINALYCYINGSIVMSGSTVIPLNTWAHVALARSGTSLKMFLNGVQEGTTYTDTNTYTQKPLNIGADYSGSYAFTGYIDDVRISKGVARYTSNFTAPTAQLEGDIDTVLLLHFNGTTGSTTFLDDGVTYQDLRTNAGGTAKIINYADYGDFGAEIRSIASASVYGNYGAYGDGDGVIGYLIGHNFAYIGTGRSSVNDPGFVIQANEIVELNRAHLYYNSVDARGDFRVGDYFSVNQQTGDVTFNQTNIQITSPTGLTFTDGVNTTIINASKVETGNIRISGNTIESLIDGITLTAANNQINVTSNTSITGSLSVTNNFTVNGNTILGDATTDTVTVNAQVNSNLTPNQTSIYDLGSISKTWNNIYLNSALIDDISISGNVITTTVSNSDLELRANGSGIVTIPSDSLNVAQNLTVYGTTNLQATNIAGTLTAGSIYASSLNVANTTTVINDIEISGNQIRTTVSNSDLELVASGSGIVSVPQNDLNVSQDLTVAGTTSLQNTVVNGSLNVTNILTPNSITSNAFYTDDIEIAGNVIRTIVSNADLELSANGSGVVVIQDSASIANNLTVGGTTNLKNTTVTGTLNTTDITTGTVTVSSTATIDSVRINNNTVTTTVSNANLELRANGSGIVDIQSSANVTGGLTVAGTTNLHDTTVTGTLNVTNISTSNITISSTSSSIGDIEISGNQIRTTVSNANLELRANGSGIVSIQDSAYILGDATISGSTTIQGDTTVYGAIVSDTVTTTNVSVSGASYLGDIQVNGNLIRTTVSNADLELRANGSGIVNIQDNASVSNNFTVYGNTNLQNTTVTGTLTATNVLTNNLTTSGVLTIDDIEINGNVIRTTASNTNLELRTNGTGTVEVEGFSISNNTITSTTPGQNFEITPDVS